MENLTFHEFVDKFKAECYNLYSIRPIVSYANVNSKPLLSLDEIELICSVVLNKRTNGKYPHGIRTKLRNIELVDVRHAFFYFCDKYGYGGTESARHLNMHHATFIHSVGKITDMLECNDKKTVKMIAELSANINGFIKNRTEAKGVTEETEVVTL